MPSNLWGLFLRFHREVRELTWGDLTTDLGFLSRGANSPTFTNLLTISVNIKNYVITPMINSIRGQFYSFFDHIP
jgi:hypothetical protein